MAFPYTIDPVRRLARVTLVGCVRGSEIAETIATLYRDPQWQYGFDTLWDSTGITELLIDRDDQRGFVALQNELASLAGPGRDVLLLKRDLDVVMGKIYAAMARSGPRETHICRTRDEALQILKAPRVKPSADMPESGRD